MSARWCHTAAVAHVPAKGLSGSTRSPSHSAFTPGPTWRAWEGGRAGGQEGGRAAGP